MYRCKLQITIFSKDSMIAETVRSIQPEESFSYLITECAAPKFDLLKSSNVVIWNLDSAVSPLELRQKCSKDTVLIFCGTGIDGFSEQELKAADALWDVPLRQRRVKIRLEHIFQQIKLSYDLYLNQTYLDTVIDSIPDMVWFKALDGIHVKVNKAFCNVVGKTRDDVEGKTHCYIWGVSPDDYENGEASCKESEDAVIQARRTLQFTENVKCLNGMRQLRTYKTPIVDRDGDTVLGTVGIGHDVTDFGNMGTEIEALLQSMPYAILLWNNKGTILNTNTKFEEYFHTSSKSVIGQNYKDWVGKAFCEQRTVNSEGYVEAKVRLENDVGKTLEIHENTIHDIFHNPVGKLCIYRDVTIERNLEKQILHSSNTDFLTGLYNRRCFYQYIHNNQEDKTVSLLYIDLDQFKMINDTYGHKVGDAVLIHTASVLQDVFREDFVARLGGDEFLVVRLGECSIRQLEEEAEQFLQKLQMEFQISDYISSLSASVGIAQSSDLDLDIDLLLQHSDFALYQAKREGRARYCVYRED